LDYVYRDVWVILTVSLHTVCLAPKALLGYNDRLFLCDFKHYSDTVQWVCCWLR